MTSEGAPSFRTQGAHDSTLTRSFGQAGPKMLDRIFGDEGVGLVQQPGQAIIGIINDPTDTRGRTDAACRR